MVVAKNDLAHRRLAHALAARRSRRACTRRSPGATSTRARPGSRRRSRRHPQDRKRMAVLDRRARRRGPTPGASPGSRCATCSAWSCTSGRTHQIRVHLEHIGHPVVGDPVYGGGGSRRISGSARLIAERIERATARQALHAASLAFKHPVTGRALEFRCRMAGRSAPGAGTRGGGLGCLLLPMRLFAIFFSSIEMADSPAVHAVVFQVGSLACGMLASRAREILAPLPTTRIPGAPRYRHRPGQRPRHAGHGRRRAPPAGSGRRSRSTRRRVLVVDVGDPAARARGGRGARLPRGPGGPARGARGAAGVDRPAGARRWDDWDGRHFVVLDIEALLAPLLGG